ncbi:MAG: carbohydrate binding domain-containing protein, partial [Clostridium sp.]|nr:carbohydrate binding domain-containing protein [Clostridium sp.]
MRCVALIVVLGIILMGCSKKTPEQSQGTQSTQEEVQTQTQTQTSEEEPANNDPVDPAPAEPDPADTVKYGENLLVNAGFENGSEGWVATGGTLEIITDEALASEGSSFAYISGRTSNWNCVAQNITDILSKRGT